MISARFVGKVAFSIEAKFTRAMERREFKGDFVGKLMKVGGRQNGLVPGSLER